MTWSPQERDELDGQPRRRIRASPAWRADDDLQRSVPGSGPVPVTALIAEWPERGHLNRKQHPHAGTRARVGVAPLNGESGLPRGRRIIRGGRARVRAGLWLGTLVAVRRTPAIRTFSQRLVAIGRPEKVALTAALHMPLLALNALVRHRIPWHDAAATRLPP